MPPVPPCATLREFVEFVAGLTLQRVRAEQAATEA